MFLWRNEKNITFWYSLELCYQNFRSHNFGQLTVKGMRRSPAAWLVELFGSPTGSNLSTLNTTPSPSGRVRHRITYYIQLNECLRETDTPSREIIDMEMFIVNVLKFHTPKFLTKWHIETGELGELK